MKTLIRSVTIVNEGRKQEADLLISGDRIQHIGLPGSINPESDFEIIEGNGKLLLPGLIDDQVHFREPGLTHKADIRSESRAAVAGGITSFMEMPNTSPQTLTIDLLEEKYARAAEVSAANYSFYMGASNDNLQEVLKADPSRVCGIKVFMGSSTGNMLVDDKATLEGIFREAPMIVAVHCEDEATIRKNLEEYHKQYGDDIPVRFHPMIRSAEACYRSSSMAVELAARYGTRLHVLHISTEKELSLFSNEISLEEKKITAEACIHHLWFTSDDYLRKGAAIRWNPAVKDPADREAIREAVRNGVIDVVATDHAPHLISEKYAPYMKSASGGPLVQHALPAMLQLCAEGVFTIETVVERMCHAPARLFGVTERGFIRTGYFADLVLVDPEKEWQVLDTGLLYKCQWSPFTGACFTGAVEKTWVNGELAWSDGKVNNEVRGRRLSFSRR